MSSTILQTPILIYGNGALASAMQESLQFRGVSRNAVTTHDTLPERSSQDRNGLARAIKDVAIVLCCVDTPPKKERMAAEERYDLQGVFACIRDLHYAGYDKMLVIRTTVSPEDTLLIAEVCKDLGAKFDVCYWPSLSHVGGEKDCEMQPTLVPLGIDPDGDYKEESLRPFIEWVSAVFSESKPGVAVMHPITVCAVSQFICVLGLGLAELLRDYQRVWGTYTQHNDRVMDFGQIIQLLVTTGYFTDVAISALEIVDGKRVPTYMLETTSAFVWEAKMKEKSTWVINAVDRRARLDADSRQAAEQTAQKPTDQ